MRYWRKISLLLVLGASLAPAQTVKTTDERFVAVRAVGEKLKCQCGSRCSYTVANCNMLQCSFREQIRPEIEEAVAAGLPTDTIVENLVAKYGPALRTAPRPEGFGAVGWLMPFVALLAGLIVAPLVIARWKKRQESAPVPEPASEETLARYREKIEQDLARIE